MKSSATIRSLQVVVAVAGIAQQVGAATANIDVKKWHQRISGFGVCSAWNGVLSTQVGSGLWDTTKGAGLSLHRVIIDRDGIGDDETKNALAANKYGVTVWGTPWFCKNGVPVSRTIVDPNTGDTHNEAYDTLYEKDYQEWADTLAATANHMKKKGAPLYAISSGNEIDLGWTKFSPEALALYVGKYLGPTLAKKAPDTKVMGTETMNWWGIGGYVRAFKSDPDAWKYSSILATHEYGADPEAYPEIQAAGKEFWETEFGFNDDPPDATMNVGLKLAKVIHRALTIANMSAWHYWNVQGGNCGALYYKDDNTQPTATKRLWVMGNWSRYVRPGFVRVDAPVEPTSGVYLSAFRDSALSKVVIVVANSNNNSVSQGFTISGVTPNRVTPIITDPSRDLVVQASQNLTSGDFTYSLPSQSVTTLVFDLGAPISPFRDSVANGRFDRGTAGWTFNVWGGGAQGSVVNGEYKIQIDSIGQHNSSIQLVQNGIILQQGKFYEVKFDAYASADRTLETNVELDVSPWTSYLPESKNFGLTTTKATYSYTFKMTNPTDSNGRVSFNAGASTESVLLDNLSIKEVATSARTRAGTLAGGARWTAGTLLVPMTESGRWQIVDSHGRGRIVDIVDGRGYTGQLPKGVYQARHLDGTTNGVQTFMALP